MSTFTFAPADSLDLSTGVYYVHIVTAEPSQAATTVSQLTISDAINYVPYTLSGLTYTTTKWTFNNFTFPTYTFNTVPLGIVICKKLGASFNNSDPVIYYADFLNTLNQVVALTTGKYTLTVNFPSNGVIAFQPYYNYTAGAYANTETIPPGLLYLLATRNGTQTWQTLTDNSIIPLVTASLDLFNKNLDNLSVTQNTWAFSFGSRRIRVGTFAFWSRDTTVGHNWSLHGSNIYTSGSIDISTDWTLLGTSASIVAGVNFITCTNTTYWKFFKLVCTTGGVLQEIEFYNSSMYSTDADLMSTVIDSPFEFNLLDNSGWRHTWTNTGSPTIQNNSLSLNGSSALTLSNSPLTNLTNRSFKLSLSFKWNTQSTASSPGIFTWDGGELPIVYKIDSTGQYIFTLGTPSGSVVFYTTTSGTIGAPTQTNYDSLSVVRNVNSLTTSVINTITTSLAATLSQTLPSSTGVTLGLNNGAYINGFIRNFKLIT